MKLGEFRALLKDFPDDAEIDFLDGNYGGLGEELSVHGLTFLDDHSRVLIHPPLWTPVD